MYFKNQKLTQKEKEAKDFAWYKEMVDAVAHRFFTSGWDLHAGVSRRRMQINYDLYNNKIDPTDFRHVKGRWTEGMEVPANLTNYDISSGKINTVLGLEMRRPFNWKVMSTNPEATTRREQEEISRLRDYVVNQIVPPEAQKEGVQPPDEVKKYMARNYQDPAEILASHVLSYLTQKLSLHDLFNLGAKHLALSGREIFYVGEMKGEPCVIPVNPKHFDCDRPSHSSFVEDGMWACAEYWMTPTDIIASFELTDDEITFMYENLANPANDVATYFGEWVGDSDYSDYKTGAIRVIHSTWMSLRKVGFLTFMDDKGGEDIKVVSENYKLNKPAGDISIEWKWIPEAHEGWRFNNTYKRMRPIPYQIRDEGNIYSAKLPYFGAFSDHTNSESTSLMDRLKPYQYYYDTIMYRIENLMASDQGKKMIFNLNAIPTDKGIDLKQFMYYLNVDKIAFVDPNQEGNRGLYDVTTLAKEVDLSLVSDIAAYWNIAERIELMAGSSIGVTPQLEGQIAAREAVQNVEKSISLSNNKLEPFFQTHSRVKRNVLQALIDLAKVVYARNPKKTLTYISDDYSQAAVELDINLLESATYGVFVVDSSKSAEVQQNITTLAQAALQNSTVDLSTVVKVYNSNTVQEAEEALLLGEAKKQEQLRQEQTMQQEHEKELMQIQDELAQRAFEREKELTILKEAERRKTTVTTAAITAAGFDTEDDKNKNNISDTVEYAKVALAKDKLEYDKQNAEAERQLKRELAQKAQPA